MSKLPGARRRGGQRARGCRAAQAPEPGSGAEPVYWDSHIHHNRVHHWFSSLRKDGFATCAITQGTLLRAHMKTAADSSAAAAWKTLHSLSAHPKHEWWDDPLSFLDVPHRHLQGSSHRRLSGRTGTPAQSAAGYARLRVGRPGFRRGRSAAGIGCSAIHRGRERENVFPLERYNFRGYDPLHGH